MMAALHFIYSTMNAGKSTALLQASHGYRERGLETMVFTSSKDNRYGESEVVSRVGLRTPAHTYAESDNIFEMVHEGNEKNALSCVLIDEAQFLTKDQVEQLGRIVDELKITVMAFGIRTDFQGELFEGSKYLLAWADRLKELRAVCHCGMKATMIVRVSEEGSIIRSGDQVEIGGNERYLSLCRKHFYSGIIGS
jgi:thymidine kinase|tara:strand:+ start:19546 stop:20130 length:585 start_codon:yes stop_codon:yes gene_type:complete